MSCVLSGSFELGSRGDGFDLSHEVWLRCDIFNRFMRVSAIVANQPNKRTMMKGFLRVSFELRNFQMDYMVLS